VGGERAGERFDARQESILKAADDEHGLGLLSASGGGRYAASTDLAVFVQEPRKLELRGVGRQAVDVDLLYDPFWKSADALADVFF
jgi:hypothetical protein